MRKHLVALTCVAILAGACGNVTTREERLAARGMSAGQQAAGAAAPADGAAAPVSDGQGAFTATGVPAGTTGPAAPGAPASAVGSNAPGAASASASAAGRA
ncbi:MAG TPA: hypothetical protein VI854_02510, partial [Acidimicrobiia bacterium]|nr:hypothetical protein [Acidimicrobiia bacterium]